MDERSDVVEAVHPEVEQAAIEIGRARDTYLNTLRGIGKKMQGLVDRHQVDRELLRGLYYGALIDLDDLTLPRPAEQPEDVPLPPHEDPPTAQTSGELPPL